MLDSKQKTETGASEASFHSPKTELEPVRAELLAEIRLLGELFSPESGERVVAGRNFERLRGAALNLFDEARAGLGEVSYDFLRSRARTVERAAELAECIVAGLNCVSVGVRFDRRYENRPEAIQPVRAAVHDLRVAVEAVSEEAVSAEVVPAEVIAPECERKVLPSLEVVERLGNPHAEDSDTLASLVMLAELRLAEGLRYFSPVQRTQVSAALEQIANDQTFDPTMRERAERALGESMFVRR